MSVTRKRPKKEGCTYGDYLTWSDDEHWEIIGGEAFDMTPMPTPIHQEFLGNLHALLWHFLRGKPCKVYPAPFDIRLPNGKETDEEIKTAVQPDIIIVCDEKKIDSRAMRGPPDMAIEILSSSSASHDHILKRRLYERHGAKGYWITDPENRIVFLYRLASKRAFGNVETLNDRDKITSPILPGLSIELSEVFRKSPIRIAREGSRKHQVSSK